ncbi:MADS-box transcription factor PHERES 2-like [Argentina anserina]|uniref:MADS-box transcription factor PHERES 2-like n=1 Tax=Argentina anserina TaxID=57926 RepID=UPI00217653E5|nr:MADS-box transcription factor PHERES 2-like [Potentilla anserina]
MGRGGGKLNMQLIADERSRRVTFLKRKKGILKKAFEFKTLCGVDMCLIIYGPKQSDRRPTEFHTWPDNPDEVNSVIGKFKLNNKPASKMYTLSDWLHEQKGKVDAKISKLRSDMYETKYPTWDDRINDFSEDQLEELLNVLDQKIESGKRTLNNLIPPPIMLLGGNHVAGATGQKLSNHMQNYAHYLGEYEDQKPSYMSMMDMHMPFSDQSSSYSQMFQYDSNLNSMMTNPLIGYPSTHFDTSGANQMIQSPAENMMMFNGVASSSMSRYSQLIQKSLSYTPYPMSISRISSQLETSQVEDGEDNDLIHNKTV